LVANLSEEFGRGTIGDNVFDLTLTQGIHEGFGSYERVREGKMQGDRGGGGGGED